MRILILGDIHGRKFWKNAITQPCDKIIFLGDYLDPYQMYEDITRKESMENLDEIIKFKHDNQEKVTLLLGNHDVQYLSKHFIPKARYDSSNAYHNEITFRSHLGLFKLACEVENNGKRILFSHAGLMNSFLERHKDYIGEPTADNLNKLLRTNKGIEILSDVSQYRMPYWFAPRSGSIVWSDVRERIDDPNDGNVERYDYQIFGHTQQEIGQPIINDKWACLDCHKAFILDENNELTMID